MNKTLLAWVAVALLPASAFAEAGPGYVDGYYIPLSSLKVGDGSDAIKKDSDGWGGRGLLPAGKYLALTTEYQESKFADINSTVRDFRIGGGPALAFDRLKLQTFLLGEYVSTNLRTGGAVVQPDGFGVHLRAAWYPIKGLSVFGQGGYVRLEANDQHLTLDGPEFSVGAAYVFLYDFGVFADYRYTQLEASTNGSKFELGDLRTGIRWSFGGGSSGSGE